MPETRPARDREDLAEVQGLLVDLPALTALSHRCDPALCAAGPSCCTEYDVWLRSEEAEAIVGILPAAARFRPDLILGDGPANPFEELGPETFALDEDDDGQCALAYRDARGHRLCAVHSAALALGVDVRTVKPQTCRLWPLTLTGAAPAVVSVQDDAFEFPCNAHRDPAQDGLDEGVQGILREVFGNAFAEAVLAAVRRAAVASSRLPEETRPAERDGTT